MAMAKRVHMRAAYKCLGLGAVRRHQLLDMGPALLPLPPRSLPLVSKVTNKRLYVPSGDRHCKSGGS